MAKNKFRVIADLFQGKVELSKEESAANLLFNAILNDELKDNKDIDQNAVIEHIFPGNKDALVQALQRGKNRVEDKELLNHLEKLIDQFSVPSFPKLDMEKELELVLFEKAALNKLNDQKIENIDFTDKNLSNKVILAYLNDNKKILSVIQKNVVIDRVINDKSINPALALAVLDKGKTTLGKEDYNIFFDKILNNKSLAEVLEKNNLIKETNNFFDKSTPVPNALIDEKSAKQIISLVETFDSPSSRLKVAVKDITGHDVDNMIKPEVKSLNLVDLAQKLKPEQITPYFPRDKALIGELINAGKLDAAQKYTQVLGAKNEKLIKDFIEMGKDWKPEVKLEMFQKGVEFEKANKLGRSEEEERKYQWDKGVNYGKYLRTKGDYNSKLPTDKNIEYQKMIIDNIKFSQADKELEQKLFALKNDELLEKYIKEAKPPVSIEMIDHLVSQRLRLPDNPNYKLLEEALKSDKLVIDEKIMSALSQRPALSPYLDKYIEKALSSENLKNSGLFKNDVLGAEFNHKAFGKVSVSQYQEHKKELASYVKDNNIAELEKFAHKGEIGGNKLSYVRNEKQNENADKFYQNQERTTLIFDEAVKVGNYNLAINAMKGAIVPLAQQSDKSLDWQVMTSLTKSLDVSNPEHAKVVAEVIRGKKNDMSEWKVDQKDQEMFQKINVEHRPYFAALESRDLEQKRGGVVALVKLGREDLASEVIGSIPQEKKQEALMDFAKDFIKPKNHNNLTPDQTTAFVEKNLLGEDKVKNAEIILELTKDMKPSGMLTAFEKLYDEKVRDKDAPKMDQVDKMFQQMPPKDLGKLLFRKTYDDKETKSLQGKPNIATHHHAKFEKAALLLQANVQKTKGSDLQGLDEGQKKEAVQNLVSNLSFKQMQNVVKTVEGYEDYSKKNWLSKALTAFVDCVSRKFNSLRTTLAKTGLKELMEAGAGVKVETNAEQKKVNVVDKPKGMAI